MTELYKRVSDEDVAKGIMKLKKLLEDPEKFEKWANKTLDMSRRRKR